MPDEPKWKRFENLVAKIQRELAPGAKITQNERIMGRRSKRRREIDIVIRQQVGQYHLMIAIDCKDYRRKVNVKDIEMFMGLIDDIGASQGAIVAASGFSAAARERAKDAGISLYLPVDAESHEWQTAVSFPSIADFREISSFSLTFSSSRPTPLYLQPRADYKPMPIYDEAGDELGNVHNLMRQRWVSDVIPMEPGRYERVRLGEGDTFVKTEGKLYYCEIYANVTVTSQLYFGNMPAEDIRGFADVIRGGVLTNGFRIADLSVMEVESNWAKIETPEQAPIEPLLTLTARIILDPIESDSD